MQYNAIHFLAHYLARAKFVAQPFMIFHASRSVGIICECGAIIQGKCTPEETQLSMFPQKALHTFSAFFSILNIFSCSMLLSCFVSMKKIRNTLKKNTKEIERHRASNRHHRNMLRHSGKEVLIALLVCHQSSLARSLASLETAKIGSSCFFGPSESLLVEICNSHARSSTAH